jgi:hypothetical protein
MKQNTIIIIATVLLCGIIAAGVFSGLFAGLVRPKPEDATVPYLIEIQKKPPNDYIDVLEGSRHHVGCLCRHRSYQGYVSAAPDGFAGCFR